MADYKTGISPLYQVNKPPFTIEAPEYTKVEGETIPRRHPKAKDGLINTFFDDVNTVYDVLKRSARLYPNNESAGSRKHIKTHKETKKVTQTVGGETREVEKEWQFFELSGYSFLTYTELHKYVLQLASGLRKLGLGKGSRLHLFASTHVNWFALSQACASQSISIVTAYDTLGESGLEHSLLQSDAEAMYIEPQLLKTATGPLKKAAKSIKFLIYNDSSHFSDGTEVDAFKEANPDFTIYSIEDIRKLGEDNPVDPVEPSPEDVFCIMYTSGSSGLPKGVQLTHKNVIAGVCGAYSTISESTSSRDRIIVYLPLAHIFELVLENLIVLVGGSLGYANPRTLADTSVRNCAGDMRELKPTIMVGVPQIWETIRKGVVGRVSTAGAVPRNLFWGIFNYKAFMVRNKMPASLACALDGVAFGKVREMTGGRIRFIMNGASGLSAETKQFLSLAIAPMFTGYGLTETCANGALGSPLEYSATAIGPVPSGLEVKLVSLPDLGYSADAKPPQGEILMRGPAIFGSYFKNPEQTAEAFTEDGWFKTGDVGEFDDDGHLKVIDRVKNLVKMQGGEYIALEKLESVYRGCRFVQNVMIDADPENTRPLAVVAPNEKTLGEAAAEMGVAEEAMYDDKRVKSAVVKDLVATAKKAGLTNVELVMGVVLCTEEWTPASGLVTATQKLNRRVIKEHYKKEIAAAYAGGK